ncbi:PREDICTED: coiled-coil domain-containing protein 178 isoform X2 [Chinchilla lanigera]|uniref:Coiled-coil domain containing 178 n=1 Tax=Chinchilla lanigera TaxID=34839 RepID=A0A8C2VFG7_CHILA|nr:PREDICTED: coiled-coil domain-containing protein 178 isoform X2 [Chinchilla lanigera]
MQGRPGRVSWPTGHEPPLGTPWLAVPRGNGPRASATPGLGSRFKILLITMLENKTISSSTKGDQPKKDNAVSQELVLVSAPTEAAEIFHENKRTNTEEVNTAIYFNYPCRRQSCALVNIPAPCVNKIISHIENVESKIQDHLKQFETCLEKWRSSPSTLKEDWSTATTEKKVKQEEKKGENYQELKQEMETLLSETIHLIKSLETDRAEAEQALKQQKSRKKLIIMRIDSWSIWRLQELPLAVQKEHQAYLRDIIELRWHLEDRKRQLEHLEKQKTQLEEANAKLQADIDFMQDRIALLDSKRRQEVAILQELYEKKFEVMEIFRQIHEEFEQVTEDSENATWQVQENKEEMDEEIRNHEINLETQRKELDKLNNLSTHYSSKIGDFKTDIEESEEIVTEVLREERSSTDEASTLSRTVDDLRKTFDQLCWKYRKYEQQYTEVLNDFYAAKRTWDAELSNVTKDLSNISIAYAQAMGENKRLANEIITVTDQINESIKRKVGYESEVQSLLKLKSKNNDYLKHLYKEAYQIGALFHVTKNKTDDMELKVSEVRRKFKVREEFLKRLIRGKVAAGIIIQKRLYSVQETQSLERQNLMKRKAIYALTLAEILEPLQQLEEDAVRIQAMHKEQAQNLSDVLQKENYVKRKVIQTKNKLQRKEKKTLSKLTKTESKRSLIFEELQSTKSKTVTFNAKINEMNKQLQEKEQEKAEYDQKLENLKNIFLTMRFKKEQAQAVFDHLTEEKRACEERISEEDQMFRTLLAMRQKTLADLKELQDNSLEENLRLAQEYQKLQMIFLTEKDNFCKMYGKQLSLHAAVSDKRQFCQLQRNLQEQWQEHFRLVVLFSQMKLAKFQTDSQETIQKILAVQEESSDLMQHILDFFQTLTNGLPENDG